MCTISVNYKQCICYFEKKRLFIPDATDAQIQIEPLVHMCTHVCQNELDIKLKHFPECSLRLMKAFSHSSHSVK